MYTRKLYSFGLQKEHFFVKNLAVDRHSKDIGSLATVTLADLAGTTTSIGGRVLFVLAQWQCQYGLADISDRQDAMKHPLYLYIYIYT